MCGRFTLRAQLNSILQQFAAENRCNQPVFSPRYNIAPTQQVPIIRSVDGHRELNMVRWGLIPPWATLDSVLPVMNNARSEEVTEKKTFKSIIKHKRCLVIADGFYEWLKVDKKTKQPYYFTLRSDKPFAFAGLWETWKNGSKGVDSCTIMTTKPNDVVAEIHDRMPVILSPDDYDLWLDPEMDDPANLTRLYKPFPADQMESCMVSTEVNNARNEGPQLIEPIEGNTGLLF